MMDGFTHHAKQRVKERGNNVIHINNKSLYKHVKKKGISAYDYMHKVKKTPLKNYLSVLLWRNSGLTVMLYQDYVFIMTKNKGKIITTYPLPKCYVDEFRDYIACGKMNYADENEAKYVVKLWNKQHQPITTTKYFTNITDVNNYVVLRMKVENCTKDYYSYFANQVNTEGKYISFFHFCIEKGFADITEVYSLEENEKINLQTKEDYFDKFELCNACGKMVMECIRSGQCKVSKKNNLENYVFT